MGIHTHGLSVDLRFEQNIALIEELVARLSRETPEPATPADHRAAQSANPSVQLARSA